MDSIPSSKSRRRRFFHHRNISHPASSDIRRNKPDKAKIVARDKQVSFGEHLTISVVEFPNPEFVSDDANVRKRVWYSSPEIRAIRQVNMDLVQQPENFESQDTANEDLCCRGLEHLIEGETKRRQRIHEFIVSICKLQEKYKQKHSKPELVADAIFQFCRTQTKSDRRRAFKLGRLDASEVRTERGGMFGMDSNNFSGYSTSPLERARSTDSFPKRRSLMKGLKQRSSWISGSMRSLGSSIHSTQSTSSSVSAESKHSIATS